MRRTLVLAAVAIGLLVPAQAHASAVQRAFGDFVLYQADDGEVNHVTVTFDGTDYTYTDSASLSAYDGCVQVDVHTATCAANPGDVLATFLGDRDDTLDHPAPRETVICGGAGNDTITGGPRFDIIEGDEGDDTLSGQGDIDSVDGETDCDGKSTGAPAGHDTLMGDDGADQLVGGPGPDVLRGGAGQDDIFAHGGDDQLDGGPDDDVLAGYGGRDTLDGADGPDVLCGGEGDDTLNGGPGADELGPSMSVSDEILTENGDDTMDGGPDDDLLYGGPARLTIFGNSAEVDSSTDATNGADLMRGGSGRDRVTFERRLSAVTFTRGGDGDDGAPGEGDTVADDVESVIGGYGDDTLVGGAGPDDLDGGRGADRVDGQGGDDALAGGREDGAADVITGGDGNDTVSGDDGDDRVAGGPGDDGVEGGGGNDQASGGDGNDRVEGGPGLDALFGDAGDDALTGGAARGSDGPDELHGGDGADSLAGASGDDLLDGGSGPDVLGGGPGDDLADYGAFAGDVSVTFGTGPDDGTAGERDDVGADVESARGGAGDDTLVGNDGPNRLAGGGGEDFILGAGGSDVLDGGEGGDTIEARDGVVDRVACGAGGDLAVLDSADALLQGARCDIVDVGAAKRRRGRAAIAVGAGSVGLGHRGAARMFPLLSTVALRAPIRADASAGTAAITGLGIRGRIAISGGAFTFSRSSGAWGARATGGHYRECSTAEANHRVRGLRVVSRGRLAVAGRYGVATLTRGGSVTVDDRCDGTLFRVVRGRARVREFAGGRQVLLERGERHLAPNGRRS